MDAVEMRQLIGQGLLDDKIEACHACESQGFELYWQTSSKGMVALCEGCWDYVMFRLLQLDHAHRVLAIWN